MTGHSENDRMNMPVQVPLMTAEEFLKWPDEPGVERWLDWGWVREKRYQDKVMICRQSAARAPRPVRGGAGADG